MHLAKCLRVRNCTCCYSMKLFNHRFTHHYRVDFVIEVCEPLIVLILKDLNSQLGQQKEYHVELDQPHQRFQLWLWGTLERYLQLKDLPCIIFASTVQQILTEYWQLYRELSIEQFAYFIIYKLYMSFANQYIQKYGERAIEAYKRSLNHADSTESPRLQPKHITNRSKSSKSIANKSKGKNSSKSMLYGNPSKAKGGMGQAFNNIHLNVGINNANKKKLIISDINTPKSNTPNKPLMGKGRQLKQSGAISTNVNVYVQAVNHSKSKQSTPARGVHNSRQNSPHKKSESQCELIKQIIALLQQQDSKRQSKTLKQAKDKLNHLSKLAFARQRRYYKMQNKFAKMRKIVGKGSHPQHSEKDTEMQERVHQLQSQLSKYKQKQKTLLRIVQSLTTTKQGHRWKESSQCDPISSQQQQNKN